MVFDVQEFTDGTMFNVALSSLSEIKEYCDCLDSDTAKYSRFVKDMPDSGVRLIGRGIWYIPRAHNCGH